MSTGDALAMRLKLRTLMQRHRIQNQPCKIPLSEPVDADLMAEGFASTNDLDLDRVRFRPYCFGIPTITFRRGYPPFLVKHDPNRIAGQISELAYDSVGNLLIAATVTDGLAKRMGAFSIRAVVNDYTIVNGDTPDFHALITSATLTEISVTDCPSNPQALVMVKVAGSPAVRTLELLVAKMKLLQQMAALIQKEVRT